MVTAGVTDKKKLDREEEIRLTHILWSRYLSAYNLLMTKKSQN
jgi:hypothetical protein